MLCEPARSDFVEYGSYACAVLGYAIVSRGLLGSCGDCAHFMPFYHSDACGSLGLRGSLEGSVGAKSASVDSDGRGTGRDGSAGGCDNSIGCGGVDGRAVAVESVAPINESNGGVVGGRERVLGCLASCCEEKVTSSRGDPLDCSAVQSVADIRGKHYERNKRKRKNRVLKARVNVVDRSEEKPDSGVSGAVGSWIKDREKRGAGDGLARGKLRESLERKWQVENELAAEKASRALAVLKANDVEGEIRRYRTKVAVQSERNMVGVERAHAVLKSTGNVPSLPGGGFAETVVSEEVPSLSSGSISPNSSASMAEFRAVQKALLDSEAKNLELIRKLEKVSNCIGQDCNFIDQFDKRTWTDTSENHRVLDGIYPNGYGMQNEFCEAGKFQVHGC